jgi:hypothetical protein
MKAPLAKLVWLALCGLLIAGQADAASRKKQLAPREIGSTGVQVDRDGTPIIMQGYRPPRLTPEQAAPKQRPKQLVKIPRGSSTYIPPVNPSRDSANSPPAAALTQPMVQPYKPPPINSFGDRVTGCIHSFALQGGIGNNPSDQQSYIRQCAN